MGLLALASALGCHRDEQAQTSKTLDRGRASVGEQIVSTVDGHPISITEVETLVRAGLTPREALRRLQAERLLMTEAARRGWGADREVEHVGEQAAVQALLQAVTDTVRVSDEEIKRAYQAQLARFEIPELRACVHVLARLAKDASAEDEAAAKAFALAAVKELRDAGDLEAYLRAKAKETAPQFKVVVERLSPMHAHDAIEQPFLDALFSLSGPGVVPQPVHTSYGWHAIRLLAIVPAAHTPYDVAAATLRDEMLVARRSEHIKALIDGLRANYHARIDEHAVGMLARFEP
jgi:parvulin-like peptidyl-prolyl cis-trans isomerase-like protein